MQERRGQLGRGLVCLLADNGIPIRDRQKIKRPRIAPGALKRRWRGSNDGACVLAIRDAAVRPAMIPVRFQSSPSP